MVRPTRPIQVPRAIMPQTTSWWGVAAHKQKAPLASRMLRSGQCQWLSTINVKDKLSARYLFREAAIINGKDYPSTMHFQVYDPATQAQIGVCPDLTSRQVDEAIAAAYTAFDSFRRTTPFERAKLLREWRDLVMESQEDLATMITLENGKPIAEAKGEVAYAASFMDWFAGEAPRAYGDVIAPSVEGNRAITIKQPVGVCGIITPWNFPAAMITRKVSAAIAAGCTVVIKPDCETPFTAIALAKLAKIAGIPDGVVNVITTKSYLNEVGEKLCTDERIKKVSFTGSTGVGKLLMGQSSSTLKKLSFELGGNAPFIVFPDTPVAEAVTAAVSCKFRGSGQTCVCANRLFVHESIYDEFCELLAEKVSGFKIGNGLEEGVTHGPLIHDRAVDKVQAHVDDAVKHGGKVLVGGKRATEIGKYFYYPTVIRDAKPRVRIMKEETFGPVAAVFKFTSEEEVIALANNVEVGLASYVMTNDINRAFRVAEQLEYGMVGVNTGIISDCATPFGGVKFSGFGREGSKYGIEEYLNIKSITFGKVGAPY
ncbi:aldehyde dehydrogenase domain-containing protein [Lipomyces doorenjongii]|uniref:aldehyde dehydrogenase domain-containing protein n=1 Tax=Lipomyces doorenjongii TaxID=383834 RepID=UPI0034CD6B5B